MASKKNALTRASRHRKVGPLILYEHTLSICLTAHKRECPLNPAEAGSRVAARADALRAHATPVAAVQARPRAAAGCSAVVRQAIIPTPRYLHRQADHRADNQLRRMAEYRRPGV
jgi:hypothetical protein